MPASSKTGLTSNFPYRLGTFLKSITTVLLVPCFSALLLAQDEWIPQVSLDDSWRWTELERLKAYDIVIGTKGRNDDVWFVHKDGLLRYDGFAVENHLIPELKSERILGITLLLDKRLLITTLNKLLIWKDGQSQAIQCPENEIFLRHNALQTTDGRILITTDADVYQVHGNGLMELNIPTGNLRSVLLDSNDNLWVSGLDDYSTKVFELTSLSGETVASKIHEFQNNQGSLFGPRLYMDSRDRVWVLDPDQDDQSYLYENYQRKPAIKGLRENALLLESLRTIETSEGVFWFCNSRKLAKWDGQKLEVYGIEDYPIPSSYPYMIELTGDRLLVGGQRLVPQVINLSSDHWTTYVGLNYQCEDPEGGLWFLARDRRVVRLHERTWKVFDQDDGIINQPNRIIVTSDGTVWVSGSNDNQAAVSLYRGHNWQTHTFAEAGRTLSYLAAIETKEANVIFGGGTPENNLGQLPGGAVIFKKNGGSYEGIHLPPPTFSSRTANVVERQGEGILSSAGDIYKFGLGRDYIAFGNDYFSNQWIDHMIVDRNNDLWVASVGSGALQHDGQKWNIHGYANGLATKNVVYLLDHKAQERVLALTDQGFYQFNGDRWNKWGFTLDFVFRRENHTVYESSDGAVWLNFSSRSWLLERRNFGRHNYAFQTIRYMPDTIAPSTNATVEKTRYPEGSQIQVQFSAVDYWDATPAEDLVYSWSLDGRSWSSYTKDSSVTLSSVAAGNHTLFVRAQDMDGNFDTTPASVNFQVFPPLWKQPWFILLVMVVVLVIFFLIHALYRFRIRAALALDEFKLDFFTNISHELRNPLAVIISPVEMLLESESSSGKRRRLQIVLRNARKMQSMVDQLLQFRKIEKAEWTFNHQGGDIVGFTRDAVMNLEPLWQAKQQTLEFSANKDSFLCNFDANILLKVIDNLISNAIKYSAEQTVIRANARIDAVDGHDYYLLQVDDDGEGIPLHEQKNVLQPFYQIKRDTPRDGAGVGLALVNQLVNLWGGSVEIKSPVPERERGTILTVKLPLKPYLGSHLAGDLEVVDNEENKDRPTLLIIDDNEDMLHVLFDAFHEQYHVIEAANGEKGYELAHELNPDLIVSDVMMPQMNGFDLCEKVKTTAETSHIPVILLTARSSTEHRIEGIQSGADAYISKPLDVKHLRARIENLLASRLELKNKFARQLVVEATDITVTPTDEVILSKAIEIVDENMQSEHFDVEKFSQLMGMSRSTLKRKLKAVTGQSPQPFIQKLRLKRAARLLKTGNLTVSEVAARVGFYDLSYFGKVFKKEFGLSPSQFEKEALLPQ